MKAIILTSPEESAVATFLAAMMWNYMENASEMAGVEEGYEDFAIPPEVAGVDGNVFYFGTSRWVDYFWDAVCEQFDEADQDMWETFAWRGAPLPEGRFMSKPHVEVLNQLMARVRSAA